MLQMLHLYRERETVKQIEANIQRHHENEIDSNTSYNATEVNPNIRVELGARQHRLLTSTFITALSLPQHSFQQQLQIFLYENVKGKGAQRMPSVRQLPSLQGTYVCMFTHCQFVNNEVAKYQVIPFRLLQVAYVSLLDSRDGLDVVRVSPNWYGSGPRHDYVIVQDSDQEGLWFAQLVELFAIQFDGAQYQIAYIQRFYTRLRCSKLTGYIELEDRNEYAFIFVDSIVRSCIVLSPGVHERRLVVGDLNDSDMYLRLLDVR
jgi:hypothetical protein